MIWCTATSYSWISIRMFFSKLNLTGNYQNIVPWHYRYTKMNWHTYYFHDWYSKQDANNGILHYIYIWFQEYTLALCAARTLVCFTYMYNAYWHIQRINKLKKSKHCLIYLCTRIRKTSSETNQYIKLQSTSPINLSLRSLYLFFMPVLWRWFFTESWSKIDFSQNIVLRECWPYASK